MWPQMTNAEWLDWMKLLLPLIISWPVGTVVIAFIYRNRILSILKELPWHRLSSVESPLGSLKWQAELTAAAMGTKKIGETLQSTEVKPDPIPSVVASLTERACRFYLGIANKKLDWVGLKAVAAPEIRKFLSSDMTPEYLEHEVDAGASGYTSALSTNLRGLLYSVAIVENCYVYYFSPKTIELLQNRLADLQRGTQEKSG